MRFKNIKRMTEGKYLIKHFSELTTAELYQLLRLRSEVFIVEQNCPYQDLDNKDQSSYHLLYYIKDELAATPDYCRPDYPMTRLQLGG